MSVVNIQNKGYMLAGHLRDQDTQKLSRSFIESADFLAANEGKNLTPGNIVDTDWVRSRYSISNAELMDPRYKNGRFYTSASLKNSNTSLGGHIAVNPKPQFTPYSDIRPRWNPTKPFSRLQKGVIDNDRLGRYYSEAIDDNAQIIYLTFGVSKFNGLLDFLLSAVDYGDQVTANTGRPPFFYNTGRVIGGFVAFACFPITSLIVYTIKLFKNILMMDKSYDYYYMTPAMHSYWSTVTLIANHFASEIGLIAPVFEKGRYSSGTEGSVRDHGLKTTIDPEDLEKVANILGHRLYNPSSGYIDIYGAVTLPQVNYLAYVKMRQAQLEGQSDDDPVVPAIDSTGVPITEFSTEGIDYESHDYEGYSEPGDHTLEAYLRQFAAVNGDGPAEYYGQPVPPMTKPAYTEGGGANASTAGAAVAQSQEQAARDVKSKQQADAVQKDPMQGSADGAGFRRGLTHDGNSTDDFWGIMEKTMYSSIHDGGQSAIFQVEYTGQVSSSFSNDVGDISLGGTLKSVAASAMDMRFNLSGGNIIGGMGEIAGAVKDVAAGVLDSATFGLSSVMSTLLGDAYIDIPKMWKDSSVSLPGASFRIKLISVAGDPFSQMKNIWIPLSMLFAGMWPKSTGPASYTTPFLCSLYAQGVQNIKMGMITSLSISSGTSNLGFTQDRRPLAIDVDFTVTDFSNIVAAPIGRSMFSGALALAYDDEGPAGRYMSTLAGRDVQVHKYYSSKLGRRLRRMLMNLEGATSPHTVGNMFGSMLRTPFAPFVRAANWGIYADAQ